MGDMMGATPVYNIGGNDNSGFIYDAKLISEPLCNISKEIIKCRRYIQDFNSASWSWHHIRYIDIILHDKYKKKEAEEYNFHD